jgi:inner membrane protein
VPVSRLYAQAGGSLTLACALLAAAPDLDLLFGGHRTYTHSLGAVLMVAFAAALVARWRKLPVARIAITCGAACGSHVLLDWLGADTNPPFGIMALWPFSHQWFISGVSIFDSVSRRYWLPQQFLWGNLAEIGWELVVLAPVLMGLWLIRVKALARFAPEMAGRHHPAQ